MPTYNVQARNVRVGDTILIHSARRREPRRAKVRSVFRFGDGTVTIKTTGDKLSINADSVVQIEH